MPGDYIKCPRCELNYIRREDEYCAVCKAELKKGPQVVFGLDEDDDGDLLDLCPVCHQNPIKPGEKMCEKCAEQKEYLENREDPDDESWKEYLDNDEEEEEDEEMLSLNRLAEEEGGFEEEEEEEEFIEESVEPDDFVIPDVDESDFLDDEEDEEDEDDEDEDDDF